MLEQIADRITAQQGKRPGAFIIVFVLFALLLLPGAFRLIDHVEPSLEKVLPPQIEEVELMNQLRNDFGADMTYVVLHAEPPISDARDEAFMTYTHTLAKRLRTIEYVRGVMSPTDPLVHEFGHVPASTEAIKDALREDPIATELLSPDHRFAILALRTDTGADAETIAYVTGEVRRAIDALEPQNPGVRAQLTGYNAIDQATFQVIIDDFAKITVISFALVALVVFLTFRRLKRAAIPLLVVMNALIWTFGITGYLGLTITVVSMVAAAMIMGLGIDFGIHVTHLYHENRKRLSAKKSLEETLRELLRAMLGGSLTTSAGFLALLFGVLPAMKTLGIILAIGITSTLIGAVFLLPAVIYATDGGTTS